MKIAILALVAILVLGGGAGGAYFYFNQKAEASIGAEGEHAAAKDVRKDTKKPEHLAFVQMDPLILPIIDANGISQMVSLVIVLQVDDEKQKATVEGQMYRIKDAYIQDMYGSLNKNVAIKDGVLQVDVLKQKLSAANNRVLGDGVVSDVLLQVVQQRPI